jgi:hypothetical protein
VFISMPTIAAGSEETKKITRDRFVWLAIKAF